MLRQIKSPLFQSSMELLGHALSHFNGEREIDRKLLILHLVNSIELLLKDLVLKEGVSIYKNPKETISIHSCISILNDKKVTLPNLNKIELLIDERNAIQHRFGSPNELTALFYMDIAEDFFNALLQDNYNLNYYDMLSEFSQEEDLISYGFFRVFDMKRDLADIRFTNKAIIERISILTFDEVMFHLEELSKFHPLTSYLACWDYLDRLVEKRKKVLAVKENPFFPEDIISNIKQLNPKISEDILNSLKKALSLRNLSVHGRQDPTRRDLISLIKLLNTLKNTLISEE